MKFLEKTYYLVTIVCPIAAIAISAASLVKSCSAEKTADELKKKVERVSVCCFAKKDGKKAFGFPSKSSAQSKYTPIIQLCAKLVIINENHYRHVAIKDIVPTLIDGSEPSDLRIKIDRTENEDLTLPFALSPGGLISINITILWPIDEVFKRFIQNLEQKHTPLTYQRFSRELDNNPGVKSRSKTAEKIYIKIKTLPPTEEKIEIKTTINLYSK